MQPVENGANWRDPAGIRFAFNCIFGRLIAFQALYDIGESTGRMAAGILAQVNKKEHKVNNLKEQIEDARARVAQCRIRAERPSARLEDDYALEKARNRLLTLELKVLQNQKNSPNKVPPNSKSGTGDETRKTGRRSFVPRVRNIGTKSEQIIMTERQRAEARFAALRKTPEVNKEGD